MPCVVCLSVCVCSVRAAACAVLRWFYSSMLEPTSLPPPALSCASKALTSSSDLALAIAALIRISSSTERPPLVAPRVDDPDDPATALLAWACVSFSTRSRNAFPSALAKKLLGLVDFRLPDFVKVEDFEARQGVDDKLPVVNRLGNRVFY